MLNIFFIVDLMSFLCRLLWSKYSRRICVASLSKLCRKPVEALSCRRKVAMPLVQEPPVQEMQLMSLGGAAKAALRPPKRKGEGTLGRKISLSANHFAVLIKNPSVFHYDVDLNPVPPSALFR